MRGYPLVPLSGWPALAVAAVVLHGPRLASAQTASFELFPDPGDLCSARRTVVEKITPGHCPSASGWSPAPVFPGATAPTLRAFCRYEFLGGGEPSPHDLQRLPAGAADPDCLVVHPASAASSRPAWRKELHRAFRAQVEPPPLSSSAVPPVRTFFAVLDSSPPDPHRSGVAYPGSNLHGFTLARFAREVGCPGGSAPCVLHVHHELALPWRKGPGGWAQPARGGDFGYQTDVAQAILRALDAWRLAGRGPLVLNLSLGWLPRFGGGSPHVPTDRVSARAVHAILSRSLCEGALVFAATGNDSGGSTDRDGPLLPAAWSASGPPRVEDCAALGAGQVSAAELGRLVAVGGVDGRDRSLGISRPDSTPRLVAPSAAATATTAGGGPAPLVLSGTSVGTLVAATAAAVARGYVPDLAPGQVIEALYASASSTGRWTDPAFCSGGVCEEVRRVSMCGALQSACRTSTGVLHPRCTPLNCPLRAAYVDARAQLRPSMLRSPDRRVSAAFVVDTSAPVPSGCGSGTLVRPAGSLGPLTSPCPERQSYGGGAHPDTQPQPSPVGCPTCVFSVNALHRMEATIELEGGAVDGPLADPQLVVTTDVGVYRYTLFELTELAELETGDRVEVSDLPAVGVIETVQLAGIQASGEVYLADLIPLDLP